MVGDVSGDGVGAVVPLAVAVFVPEEVELVDVEGGEAVAELGVAQRREPVRRPGVRDRRCRARRGWR